jgi:hypothetical protein
LVFRVDITDSALADAEDFFDYVRCEKHDDIGAERWWNGVLDALFSLERQPGRGTLVVEAAPRNAATRCAQMKTHPRQTPYKRPPRSG